MKRCLILIMLVLWLLTACASGEVDIPTATVIVAISATPTQIPATHTSLPTTNTSVPPTKTAVPDPTQTATSLPTGTPTPLPSLSGSGGGIIAFTSERDGNAEIYLMNADGSDPRRLTNHPFGDYMGDWSPDGNQIVFHSTRDRKEEIYIIDIDLADNRTEKNGATIRRITEDTDPNYEPVWSPDGSQIAYEARLLQTGDAEIAVIDLDGNVRKLLTENSISDFEPDWSPDGSRILFGAQLADTRVNLFVINADGSDRQQLTTTQAHDWFAKWSPDGEMIAFASDRDGDVEIYVMDQDGSNQRQLTYNNAAEDTRPRWSPDGSKIIFESDRDGDFEIYLIDVEEALQNPDGNQIQQLTDNDMDDRRAVWKPVPIPVEPALSIEVPQGVTPTINGRLSEGEWDGAQVVSLTGGGELYLLHADGYLFLGIREQEPGIGSVCHYQNGKISIMHASAGLVTSIYEKGTQDWEMSTAFYGCCMDLPETMRQDEQLKDQGWVANLFDKGLPNEMEYQIALGDGDLILAVTYILLDSPTFVWWPEDLDDDCGKLESVDEVLDISHLQFDPETWVKLIFMEN